MKRPTFSRASSFPAFRSFMYAAAPNAWIQLGWAPFCLAFHRGFCSLMLVLAFCSGAKLRAASLPATGSRVIQMLVGEL